MSQCLRRPGVHLRTRNGWRAEVGELTSVAGTIKAAVEG